METAARLLAAVVLMAPGVGPAAEAPRYGYCTWASPAPGQEAIVSSVYAAPARIGSVHLARSFADYINAGRRDRPRHFTPVCFREFESEAAARARRNEEIGAYRQRGFTLQVVGGWTPPQ
jgi:hypothetical protein